MEKSHHYEIHDFGATERIYVQEVLKSPCCNAEMAFDHIRKRIYLDGDKHILIIEVHRCPECGNEHSILPDFLEPYKRYSVSAICKIVKSPTTKSVAVPSTKIRMKEWMNLFLDYLSQEVPGYGEVNVDSCSVTELSDILRSAPSSVESAFREKQAKT